MYLLAHRQTENSNFLRIKKKINSRKEGESNRFIIHPRTTILTSNNYSTRLHNQEPDQKQFIDFSS